MTNIKTLFSQYWRAIAIAALLLMTQFAIFIPNPASTSGSKTFNMAELPLLIGGFFILWQLIRTPWSTWSKFSKYLITASVLSTIAWIASIVARKVLTGSTPLQITPIEYLLLGVIAFLISERAKVTLLDATYGLLGFLFTTNIYSLIKLAQGITVRRQSLLGNTNLYVGVVLMIMPVILLMISRTASKKLYWVSLFTSAHTIAIIALSGSRFGGVASLFMLFLTFLIADRRPWKKKLIFFTTLAILAAVIFGGLILSNKNQLHDVARTFNIGSVITGSEPDTEDIKKEDTQRRKEGKKVEQKFTEQDRFTTLGDPDHDVPPAPPQLNIFNHSRVAHRSIAVLKDHWLLGTGRIGPYFSGYGYQPAHNIIMEIILYMGIFGAPFFFAILFSGPFAARNSKDRYAWLLGFCGLVAFAMFQPLLSDALVTILPLWLTLGGLRNQRPQTP
ncbi:MAG: O-antigen ligase family protein [Propionibacteriaceae bacterium]